jgi:uncharacterized protein YegP (UPF0339 family)
MTVRSSTSCNSFWEDTHMRRLIGVGLALATCLFVVNPGGSALAQGKDGLKFELYKDAKQEFRWRLKGPDGKVLATGGQGYKGKADCKRGIEIIQEASDPKSKSTFEVYEDAKKDYRWRLKASNGQIVASSAEGYKTKADAESAVATVKKAAKAAVDDQTKK